MKKIRRVAIALVGVVGLGVLGAAHAADAVRGKALFSNTNGAPKSCGTASCHSGFPNVKVNSIAKGSNPTVILNAISSDKGGMRQLAAYVNTTDANDIAAYIANPAAGTGSPAIALSATTLTFAAQTLGTTSAAQTVTVSNTGTAVLTLAGLTLGGTASAEFARGGTCQPGTNVAVGATCSIQLTFTPTVAGTRNATVTITHNATGGTSALSLVGTGALAPAVASVTPAALSFTQTINSTSIAQAVTVRNNGGQPLTLGAIGISGVNAAEYVIGAASTCSTGTVLSGGANCNLQVTFRPTVAGARSAQLSIAHNATASPALVALTGTGTATPQPAVSVSVTTLSFGTISVGQKSAAQAAMLTNSGEAPLTLASLTLGGTSSSDFALAGNCASGATVAAGGTCTMQLTFAPTAVGARSATLTVASNAANGSPVVALSGSGVQYAIAVNPASVALQSTVGTMSASVQAVVTNSGASPITLSSITIAGPFVMQPGSNACGEGPMDLIPGQACSVYVAFMPATAGPATGEVTIASASLTVPTRIALTAQASAQDAAASNSSTAPSSSASSPGGSAAVAPSNLGGGCTVGASGELIDPLLAVMLAVALFEVLRRRARQVSRDRA
jgi:trimeric autotransporter adhesin